MVAKSKKAVAIQSEIQLPAYMQGDGNQGNENVGGDDVSLPRLSLLQSMSPEATKNSPKYIEGAEPGMFMNSITKELYPEVNLINVFYSREWPIFRRREHGGGFIGKQDSAQAAEEFIQAHAEANNIEAVETANHYCIMVNDEGEVIDKVLFGLTSTKLRFSRNWNSLIVGKEGARFSYVWNIKAISESNKKGTWFSPAITTPPVIAKQEAYELAAQTYENVSQAA